MIYQHGLIKIKVKDEMTEEEMEKLTGKVVSAIVSCSHAIYTIEELSHQDQIWMRELKNYGNLFLKRLLKTEEHFDTLEGDSLIGLAETQQDFVEEVKTIHLTEMQKITNVLRALKKDEKSVLGICKKVLGDEYQKEG